ncbi:MAG: hypothetical protein WA160_01740 [Pseudobdellovibrio sp.]
MDELSKLVANSETILLKVQQQLHNPTNAVDRLYHFASSKKDEKWEIAFFLAMQETLAVQSQSFSFYQDLSRLSRFDQKNLTCFNDIEKIPFITSSVLKKYEFNNSSNKKNVLTISSSGTSGQKAHISFDDISLIRIISGIFKVYSEFGLANETPTNYLFASYSPVASGGEGTAGTDQAVCHLTPILETFYALDLGENGNPIFLKNEAIEQLRKYILEGKPIRILGFLHYICEIVKAYYAKYGKLIFPENSYILSGGGWKNFADAYGNDFNVYEYLCRYSSLEATNIRDSYSLVEHPILYVACEKNNLHVSALAHVVIRDVQSMKVLPYGKQGLVHLFSPILQSYPTVSLMTSDIGCLNHSCSCGRQSDYLQIIGRGGSKKQMTCALNAEQYLVRGIHAE